MNLRVIGGLLMFVYALTIPGVAPFAFAELVAAGKHDHEHEARFTAVGGQMSLVMHHHVNADDHLSETVHHDKDIVPHNELSAPDAEHSHGDHVFDLSLSSAPAFLATAKTGILPAPDLAPTWELAPFSPVWLRELKCAATWGHPPPGGTGRMTCLRSTVLVI